MVYYDSAFYDKKINNPQTLSGALREESQKVTAVGGPILAIPLLLGFSMLSSFIIAMIINQALAPILIAANVLFIYIMNKSAVFFNTGFDTFKSEKINNLVSSALSNYKTMTALNLQDFFYEKYSKYMRKQMQGKSLFFITVGFLYSLRFGYTFIVTGAVLLIGGYFVKINALDIDEWTKMNQVINSLSWILLIVSILIPDLVAASAASKTISKLLGYSPHIDSRSQSGLKDHISGKIQFTAINFKYRYKLNYALKDCSFLINPGESLGIVGKTGSGKSSIAMLLIRFYNPSSGGICIDDRPIEAYNVGYLRSRICWVGQEPVLFNGSIFYNLHLGNARITREEAADVMRKAQAQDVLDMYGLDSGVGVRGALLSGGQKQRIAIARAFARNPAVLILDEATSALDNITEARLKDVLRDEKITVIAIAHRIDSIANYDNIIVLDKGRIVQQGVHEQLAEADGI